MPTPQDLSCIDSAIANIRCAETSLDAAIAGTGDPSVLEELTTEYNMLTDLVSALASARLAADDGAFETATTSLSTQATALKSQETHIKAIITDVSIAAKVVGYIAQAVTFIEAL